MDLTTVKFIRVTVLVVSKPKRVVFLSLVLFFNACLDLNPNQSKIGHIPKLSC
jgi:hypothetical protein